LELKAIEGAIKGVVEGVIEGVVERELKRSHQSRQRLPYLLQRFTRDEIEKQWQISEMSNIILN